MRALTPAESRAYRAACDYGDANLGSEFSPADVFPERDARDNAARRTLYRLIDEDAFGYGDWVVSRGAGGCDCPTLKRVS